MAEPLGELDIQITGDFSALSDALQSAVTEAQAGAQQIADAFEMPDTDAELVAAMHRIELATSDAGAQMSLFAQYSTDAIAQVNEQLSLFDTQSIDGVVGGLNAISVSAEDSIAPVTQTTEAIKETGEAAQTSESGLRAMAEQLAAIGEALVITEGLKSFGEEALTAAGTIQSVDISLTALTGSATDAKNIIDQIKSLAETEPFAFPDIAPTIQRMVAFGATADQIPTIMQAVADSSAATGIAFSNVAQRMDMLANSGTLMARGLMSLGINLHDVALAMNTTDDAVKAAFKDLPDAASRFDVLSTAMEKFGGTAIAQAQGISGQWTIFQNKFEEAMVGIGNALTPVVSDILRFGEVVISAIQVVVQAFGELPVPIQDVVVTMGLVAAAAIPVVAGLAAIGLGLSGLSGLAEAATGFMAALAGTESASAVAASASVPAHAAAATAIEAEGAAAETASVGMGAAGAAAGEAGTALGIVGTAAGAVEVAFGLLGAAMLVFDFEKVTTDARAFGTTLDGVFDITGKVKGVLLELSIATSSAGTSAGVFSQAWSAVKSDFSDSASNAALSVVPAIQLLDGVLKTATLDVQLFTNKWPDMQSAIAGNLKGLEDANAAIARLGISAATSGETTSASIAKIVAEVDKQNAAVQQATAVYNTLNAAYTAGKPLADGTVVTAQMLAAAHKALATATQAATDAVHAHTGALNANKDSVTADVTAANQLQTEYNNAQKAVDDLTAKVAAGTASAIALGIAQANLAKIQKEVNQYIQDASGDLTKLGTSAQTAATGMQAINDKVTANNKALQAAIVDFNDVRAAVIQGTGSHEAYVIATNNLTNAYKAAHPEFQGAKSDINDVYAAALKAAEADRSWYGAHQQTVTVIAGGKSTIQGLNTDLQNINDGAGKTVTGLGKLADADHTLIGAIADGTGALRNTGDEIGNVGNAAATAGTQGHGSALGFQDLGDAMEQTWTKATELGDGFRILYGNVHNSDLAIQNVQGTIYNADGTIVKFTGDLSKMADEWTMVADAADKAATAITNAGDAETTVKGKGGAGGAGGYIEGVNPGEQASQTSLFFAGAGVGQYINYNATGSPSTGQPGGQATFGQQGLSGAGPFLLAEGGIVYDPTLAIIGESGPEAVVPLGRVEGDLMQAASNAPSPSPLSARIGGVAPALTSAGQTGSAFSDQDAAAESAAFIAQQLQNAAASAAKIGDLGPAPEAGSALGTTGTVLGNTTTGSGTAAASGTPPVYKSGTGVVGTPRSLVSTDGGSTWTDAGMGNFAGYTSSIQDLTQNGVSVLPNVQGVVDGINLIGTSTAQLQQELDVLGGSITSTGRAAAQAALGLSGPGGTGTLTSAYAPPAAPSQLTPAQVQAMQNLVSTIPGQGFTGGGQSNTLSASPTYNLNFSGAHIYGSQGAQQFGTSLVNALKQNASLIKY